jgi:pilus assembly protein Flp/PilA
MCAAAIDLDQSAAAILGLACGMKTPTRTGRMLAFIARVSKDTRGVTAVEYGLIAALIAVVAILAITTVGHGLSTTFNTVATKL